MQDHAACTLPRRLPHVAPVLALFPQGVAAAGFVLFLYGKPLIYAPPEVLAPFGRMLAMPHGKAFIEFGAVAIVPWMMICNRASNTLAQALFPTSRRAEQSSSQAQGLDETKKDR